MQQYLVMLTSLFSYFCPTPARIRLIYNPAPFVLQQTQRGHVPLPEVPAGRPLDIRVHWQTQVRPPRHSHYPPQQEPQTPPTGADHRGIVRHSLCTTSNLLISLNQLLIVTLLIN